MSDLLAHARELAAQCWCDDETSDIEMDVRLAEAFAKRCVDLLERIAALEQALFDVLANCEAGVNNRNITHETRLAECAVIVRAELDRQGAARAVHASQSERIAELETKLREVNSALVMLPPTSMAYRRLRAILGDRKE